MIQKELEEQAFALLAQHKIQDCIHLFEGALKEIPSTPYHAVIGRDLLSLTGDTAAYLQNFYNLASATVDLKAIYLEMNGFAINPKRWYLDAFGYKSYGGIDELDWLSDWDSPDFDSLTISGFEDIQMVFATHYLGRKPQPSVKRTSELTEYLVTLRMQELVSAAHREASERVRALKGIIVLSTSHDFDFVSESSL